MQIKYSIIIPIFNAEKTIRRCLESLLTQSRASVELLLIDDGSSDQSLSVCREYEGADQRIRLFTKEHGGVSAARNYGLDRARGTYILFVDSDDYVEPTYFEKLDQVLQGEAEELVCFSYRLVGTRTSTVRMPERETTVPAEIADRVAWLLRKQQLNALWSKVFLRSVIERNGLRFDESLCIDEDVNLILAYVVCVDALRFSSEVLYNTCLTNPESLTRRKREYLCEQLQRAGINRKNLLEAASLTEPSKRKVAHSLSWLYYRGAYSSAAELLKYPLSRGERREKIRSICSVFAEGDAGPQGLRSAIIAAPVRLRMTRLIDRAAIWAVRRRKL